MRKRLRALRVIVLIACVAWFARYAYVRMTTPPAAPTPIPSIEDEALAQEMDATSTALADALAQLPTPAFDEPAPEGMAWMFDGRTAAYVDPLDIINGPWDPDSRAQLRVIVRHLTSPGVSNVLAEIRRLRNESFRADMGIGWLACERPAITWRGMRNVAKLLTARARYYHAELGDVSAAWDDLKTVLLLGRSSQKRLLIGLLVNTSTDALCLRELQTMCREVALDDDVAADIEEWLSGYPGAVDSWAKVVRGEAASFGWGVSSGRYTDDGRGSGWLVLSDESWMAEIKVAWGLSPSTQAASGRSRLWNLASPLFNDRRTAQRRHQAGWHELELLATMSYAEALARVEQSAALPNMETVLDAPTPLLGITADEFQSNARAYWLALSALTEIHAGRIMVALNRFRQARQRYPERLEELVPAFIAALPTDPFCDSSYGYRRVETDDYLLYCCGRDGDDDGGEPMRGGGGDGEPWRMGDVGDHVYTLERSEPYSEPQLRPVASEPDEGGGS
ncbi:MAG: hypothetical protein GY842_18920 [bacterium]|nr:hypothetical protein [bacterium]